MTTLAIIARDMARLLNEREMFKPCDERGQNNFIFLRENQGNIFGAVHKCRHVSNKGGREAYMISMVLLHLNSLSQISSLVP